MTRVRVGAAEILLAVGGRRTTLAAEVDREREGMADPRDRALLLELVTGVLRWQNELDALIEGASRRAIAAIDAVPLVLLRMGVYQLRHLTRIPVHAAVNESVEAARALGSPKAAGFVNAVLRRVSRPARARDLPLRPSPDAAEPVQIAYLVTTLSHPAWLVRRWLSRYGFDETERWCLFNNTRPEMTVRSAGRLGSTEILSRLRADGVEAAEAPFAPEAIRLPPGALGDIAAPLRDELVVQDEASQLVARFAAAMPGERVLDLCASPGGKAMILAADLARVSDHPGPSLVAADFRPSRIRLLTRTVAAAPHPVAVVALDARHELPFRAVFDCVLVDAPCSGLGTVRRDPDLKWTRTEADLVRFAADQRTMLGRAAAVVRPGGRLVYATCSSEPEENAEVVDAFLASAPGFRLATASERPAWPAALLDAHGQLVTTPARHGLDAFFAAILVRPQRA